ncbi:cell division protein ZipA [Gallibacterium melopsittaci]|uniref:Cell division protein ZipA n=1 Tax=Gallibacterium melopsittaci TaxID=516063 RepID=A0ABV6HVH2_9PAST
MDLQQILILLGVLALGILIGHGVWSSRREKAQFEKSAQQFERQHIRSSHANHFPQQDSTYPPQQHGVHQQSTTEYPPHSASYQHTASAQHGYSQTEMTRETVQRSVEYEAPYQAHLPLEEEATAQQVERRVENIKITLPNSSNSVSMNQVESTRYESTQTVAEPQQRYADTTSAVEKRAKATMENTVEKYEESASVVEEANSATESAVETVTENNKKPDFIMLYVVAPENRQFYGTHINEVLEDLGFIFGEYNIYHRHLDVNMVNSPVIFSVANMVQPGTFDPNNFDNFATIGLTLFMRLPSPGNDIVNFRMLCCAAETLAEKLNGFVLNGNREIFTDESRNEYLQLLRS